MLNSAFRIAAASKGQRAPESSREPVGKGSLEPQPLRPDPARP